MFTTGKSLKLEKFDRINENQEFIQKFPDWKQHFISLKKIYFFLLTYFKLEYIFASFKVQNKNFNLKLKIVFF